MSTADSMHTCDESSGFGAGAIRALEQRAGVAPEENTPVACPFVTAQQVLQGKWSVLVLHHLADGPLRFNQLRKRLPQLTAATLTNQLRYLEEHGMIKRIAYPEVPPRVEYSLTELGEDFKPVLDQIQVWGTHYLEHLQETHKNR
ncbi:MAG: winged helix-turn-helix transcriptional regulator [Atopobiaceae bacterium]|jgi:DNA-binding HxlR family transcriptional regulator